MWKNSLKTKLIISFASITLVAIIVTGASALTSMKRTVEQEIQNKLLLLAEAEEGKLYAYLDSLESRTVDFTSDGFIRDSLKEIIDTGSANAVGALNEHLIKNKKPLDESLFCIIILDMSGKVVSSVFKEEIGSDESKTVQFIEGKKGVFVGEEVGEAEFESGKANILSISAPITDKNTGKLLGIIVNSFTINKLDQILSGEFQIKKGALTSSQGLAKTLTVHLVNKEKKILAHSHKETGQHLDTINTLPVQKCLDNQEEISGIYINHFDEEVIGASMCFPQRGWTLLVEINTQEAFASVRNTTYGLVIMLVLILVFIILDIFFITGRIVNPLKKLHEASDIIAKGNLDYRVDIKTKDEVQQLAEAFNDMAANLKKSHLELQEYSKRLEEKVAEKTKDLQSKVDDLNKTREAVLNVAEDAETERERTATEKDKINTILRSIGDGVFVIDKDYKIIMFNEVATGLSGFSAKEIIGKRYDQVLKFVFEKDEKVNDQFIKEAIATGEIKEMSNHTVLIRKDGSRIAVADSAAPLKDKGGKVTGCVVVFRDVTKEREVDKAKTEFVSLASHQLRTPLTSIGWYVEMLQSGDAGVLNDKQKGFLSEVYTGNKRMVELVNALLNVSRMELGTFVVEPVPTDVVLLARNVVAEQKPQIEAKKLKLSAKYAKDLPLFNADLKLLRMVFQNLLSNAVKYTPDKGKVGFDIWATKKGEEVEGKKIKEDSIAIMVSDTGYGIPEAQQDKIFTKLFRADNVREKDTDGTGLGLYIVKAIVGHSGGEIWFTSQENKGTTFYVTLPLTGMKKKEGTKSFT